MSDAKNFFGGENLVVEDEKWLALPVKPEDFGINGVVDDALLTIVNEVFPGKYFTKENINEILGKAGITNGEMRKALDAYAFGPVGARTDAFELDEIKEKVSKAA